MMSLTTTSAKTPSPKGLPVFRISPKGRIPLKLLVISMSAGLFAYLIWRAGPGKLWENIHTLGWGFTLVIALAGVSHLAKTWAWRLTLVDDKHKISFPRMLGLRLGAEAAGQLGILGQTFGDSVRVSHMSPEVPVVSSVASVTLDRGFYFVTGTMITLAGILAALPVLSRTRALGLYAGLFVLVLLSFLLLTLLALRKRWPVFSGSARILARVPSFRNWIVNRSQLFLSIENTLLDFHHHTPGAFWTSFLLNLGSHCMALMEVCLILWLMGVKIGFFAALVIEGLTKLVSVVGNCNPGNIGTYEGGNMLIGKMFGLSSATGLALGLTRRLRSFFWAAVGLVCFLSLSRSRKRRDSANPVSTPANVAKVTSPRSDPPNDLPPFGELAVAFLLSNGETNRTQFQGSLARVGTLPILLRTILAAGRLVPSQIMVVVGHNKKLSTQRQLFFTGRLPESVQWIEASAGTSFSEQLQLIATHARSERVLLIDGNTTYHPSLLRKAQEWDDEGTALALTSGDKFAGILAIPVEMIRDFAKRCPTRVGSFEELQASLIQMHSGVSVPVPEDLWQCVDSPEDRLSAERKLDRWLVKPTDGIYARLNRRISIPISRQLIRLPITANMVTLFTLGVGLVSGIFFALGGYWNTLLGAVLCLWASILDGSDGEVARLKLLESDFGCWLETICDYLFYLILFVGMTIGLWRSSGSKTYLVGGGLLLFGAIATFLATAWERHRLAAGRPEQLLKIWQGHAESRPSNPFLFIGRHLEFIIRRCFFPYALLFFALFHIMNLAFVLAAIGANLVWPIALYSSRTFAGARRPVGARPAASAHPTQAAHEYATGLP